MPLIKCPMCDRDISPNAISCPHCGEPMVSGKKSVGADKSYSMNNVYTEYNVFLTDCGKDKILIIKYILDLTHKKLNECKDLVEDSSSPIIICDSFNESQEIKKDLMKLGAEVRIEAKRIENENTTPLNNKTKYIDYTSKNKLEIKCPNCSSIKTQKISGTSKVGSALVFGVFSLGKLTKSWECKTCKYRW